MNSSWAATWARRASRARTAVCSYLGAVILAAGCADLNEIDPPPGLAVTDEWDYVTSLPGDEAVPCFERGNIRLSAGDSIPAGTITSYETNCGLPAARDLYRAASATGSVAFTAGNCTYAGMVMGTGPDSIAGEVTCVGRGSGPWAAWRVGAPDTLVLDPGDRTLSVGGAQVFTATLRDAAGYVLYGRAINWASGNTAVAAVAVTPPGTLATVTAVAPGSAVITATSEGVGASVAITVGAVSFTRVGVGPYHTCGLSASGTAWCWGNNTDGMLGTGDTVNTSSPVPVAGGHAFAAIAGGRWHTCALDTAGAAWCWGYNGSGWLGDGTLTDHLTPAPVAGGLAFTSLVASDYHTCALTAAGAAWCWGGNGDGQLGDSTRFARNVPTRVVGGHTFVELAAGREATCGRTAAGAAWCWGGNQFGQQGTGSTDTVGTAYPSPVAGGHAFMSIAAGRLHACGVDTGGAAWCWGSGTYGQTGLGSRTLVRAPAPVTGGLTFASVSGTADHTCGRTSASALWCWGSNGVGQLGVPTPTESDVPLAVSGNHLFGSVATGEAHSCAVDTASVLWCWGSNWYGQLGDGTRTDRRAPVRVIGQP